MELVTDVQDQRTLLLQRGQTLTLQQFDEIFSLLFNRTWVVKGKEYNLSDLGWKRDYNRRKRSLGLCTYSYRKEGRHYSLRGPGTVWISKTYLTLNLDSVLDFEDTVRHEIAHAIDCEIRGRSNHDAHWKSIAVEVGARPNRINKKVLERPKAKYKAECSCGSVYTRHRLTAKARRAACSNCCNNHNGGRYTTEFVLNWKEVA